MQQMVQQSIQYGSGDKVMRKW